MAQRIQKLASAFHTLTVGVEIAEDLRKTHQCLCNACDKLQFRQRFVTAWHDRCLVVCAEGIAAADANECLMLQRNGTAFWPCPRVLARPLQTAGPRTRPEMAHAPRGKHLRVSHRVSHVVGPAVFDCVDRYVPVDVRPVLNDKRRPSNGPDVGAFDPFDYGKALK